MALSRVPELGKLRGVALAALFVLSRAALAGPVDDAKRLISEGEREAAAAVLADVIDELDLSERAHALYLLATLSERWTDADSLYSALLDSHRESPWAAHAMLELGEHALLAGQWSEAQKLFDRAALETRSGPVRARALLRDAQALLLMNQPGEARVRLHRLLDEEAPPAFAERARLLLATCAHQEGMYGDALRLSLELVGDDHALQPPALASAARALLARGESELALSYLRQLADGYPDTADGALARALADSLTFQVLDTSADAPPDTSDAGPAASFGTTRPSAGRPAGLGEEHAAFGGGDEDPGAGDPGAEQPLDGPPAPGDAPSFDAEARAQEPEVAAGEESADGVVYFVQLGAFANRIGALTLLSTLRRSDVDDAEIERVEVDGRRAYRVRVGPFATRGDAEAARPALERTAEVEGSFVRGELR